MGTSAKRRGSTSAATTRNERKSTRPRRGSGGAPARKKKAPSSVVRWALRGLKAGLLLGAIAIIGLIGLFIYYGRDLPTVEELRSYKPAQTTRIVDRKGEVIGEFFSERRTVVPMERMPRHLILSVLAAEDADFYQHEGIDYPSIVRVMLYGLTGKRLQGGSTITQQVARNHLLSLDRKVSRKVREMILSRKIERSFSKEEILFLYLNHINFGHGRYGVQEASRYYFGKNVENLTLAESALIAGIPQSPTRLSPRTHPENAKKRQRYVLSQLRAKRSEYWPDLSVEQIEAAEKSEIKLVPPPAERPEHAYEVRSHIERLMKEHPDGSAYRKMGLTIHTTLDLELQTKLRRALRAHLRSLDRDLGYRLPWKKRRAKATKPVDALKYGKTYVATVLKSGESTIEFDVAGQRAEMPRSYLARFAPKPRRRKGKKEEKATLPTLDEGALLPVMLDSDAEANEVARVRPSLGPEAAIVVLDVKTAEVLAMVGGYADRPGLNRALQAKRQPGSTFKTLVYGYGIEEQKITAASIVLDAPVVYDEWKPSNFESWNHQGPIRIREALAKSVNLVAVRTMEDLGPEEVAEFARSLGIESDLQADLALALGASAVTPMEMVLSYSVFANSGQATAPRWVTRIEGPGKPWSQSEREPTQVMSAEAAAIVTSMLRSVVTDGTGAAANSLPFEVAGKTGTSNKARDAWFVGYSSDLVIGVWVGFDDGRPLGRKQGGSRTALPLWIEAMKIAMAGRDPGEFVLPDTIVRRTIDPKTGLLAYDGQPDAIEEIFIEGTEPTETAAPPDQLDTTSFLVEELGGP